MDAANAAGEDARAKAKAEGKTDSEAQAEARAAKAAYFAELNLPATYFSRLHTMFRNIKRRVGFNRVFRQVGRYVGLNLGSCDIKEYRVKLNSGQEVSTIVKEGCDTFPCIAIITKNEEGWDTVAALGPEVIDKIIFNADGVNFANAIQPGLDLACQPQGGN